MTFLEKHKNIIDFTLSSLFRMKAKNISLTLVYTFVIFLVASILFFTNSIREEALQTLRNAPEVVVQRLRAGRHELVPLTYMETLKGIRGVQSVKPRLWGYYYDPSNDANYTIVASEDFENSPGMVAIGNGVARNLVTAQNGAIPFRADDGSLIYFRIQGVLASESELETSDLVLMNENDFRKLFDIPKNLATDLVLHVRNSKELATISLKITQLLPGTRAVLRDDILRTYDAIFNWRGGLALMVLSGALLAFIILAWDKATGLSAEERREIGVLKALGWETSDVLLMKFWEGAVVSLAAFFIGVLLAYLHVFFGSFIVFESAIKGWSVLYPAFKLTPFINVYHVATVFFLTVIPYTAATIAPSWRAATVDPDSVMRT